MDRLSLQAEWHGLAAVEGIHDLTGTLAVVALIIAIWLCGVALRLPQPPGVRIYLESLGAGLRSLAATIPITMQRVAAAIAVAGVLGIAIAQIASAKIEGRDQAQTMPFFLLRETQSQTRAQLPRDVWNELHPSSAEYIRVRDPQWGAGETFHFFWKPSPWNRFVLVHRPDICMPGIGWEMVGPSVPITIEFSAQQKQFYLFRFRRGEVEALELWGAWRNGETVPLDYEPDQVTHAVAGPSNLHLEGKRRSATEIVACVIDGNRDRSPDAERAITMLRSVFEYNSAIK